MKKAIEVIEDRIAITENHLVFLRDKFDQADANNPSMQVAVASMIAETVTRLDTLRHLLRLLSEG